MSKQKGAFGKPKWQRTEEELKKRKLGRIVKIAKETKNTKSFIGKIKDFLGIKTFNKKGGVK